MALSGSDRAKVGSWLTTGQRATSRGYEDLGGYMSDATKRAGGVWAGNQDWGLGELGKLYSGIDSMIGYGARPGYRGQFDESKDWWKGLTDTGWRTPEQKEAGWGWGTFKDFATTGGWSPTDIANFRAQSVSGMPELYGGLRNELMRGRSVQGGYGPGYSESYSQLARDQARSLGEARLAAESSLANSIRQGKMWGGEQGRTSATTELGNMVLGRGKLDEIAAKIAEMNRSAGGGFSPMDALRMKMGLIGARTDLARETGGDLPYGAAWGGALGGRAASDIGYAGAMPQKGPSFWDKLLGAGTGVVSGLASGGYL